MHQNPETPDQGTAAVTGSSRRAQEPAEASVLAALEVLGWPDDRLTSAHPDLTDAGHYWSYVSGVLAAADAADTIDAALSGLQRHRQVLDTNPQDARRTQERPSRKALISLLADATGLESGAVRGVLDAVYRFGYEVIEQRVGLVGVDDHDRDPELADALHAATSLPRSELLPEVRRIVAEWTRQFAGTGPRTVVFKLVPYDTRAHTACRLYAGPDHDHLALCGDLRLRHNEYAALQDALTPPAAPIERELVGPPHAHLDASCTDACYEPAEPTNTTERPEDAARRFAGELEQLRTGLEARGIPLRNGPVGISAALTALAELDRLRRYIEQRDQADQADQLPGSDRNRQCDTKQPHRSHFWFGLHVMPLTCDGVPEVKQADSPHSPAAKLRSLRAHPHGSACNCDDCTARDEAEQDRQAVDCNGDQA